MDWEWMTPAERLISLIVAALFGLAFAFAGRIVRGADDYR